MFEYYLNQTCEHKKFISETDYSEPVYSEPMVLKCRIEVVENYAQETTGGLLTLNTRYVTSDPVQEGDLLDGRRVMSVDAPPLLGGFTPLYWSYVQ